MTLTTYGEGTVTESFLHVVIPRPWEHEHLIAPLVVEANLAQLVDEVPPADRQDATWWVEQYVREDKRVNEDWNR